MQTPIPVKRKNHLIYLAIIISFLFIVCVVWWFFGSKIKEVEIKKKDQLSAKLITKEKNLFIDSATMFFKPA